MSFSLRRVTEIRNVRIPDFFHLSVSGNMTVGLEGGRVVSVEPSPAAAAGKVPGEDGVIDGKGMVLIPGMLNLHAHTAMTLLRGTAEDCGAEDWFNKHIWIYEQGLTPDDVYLGTLLGGAEMLLNGVTAVADHYFAMDRAWEAYNELGMRADLSQAVFGVGDGADKSFQSALEFNSEYGGRSPLLSVSLGPHSPYLCPDDFLRRTVDEAGREGLKVHIHAAEDERQLLISMKDRGKTPIEVLRDTGVLSSGGFGGAPALLAHAYYATDSDLQIMAASSCISAHCPKTYLRFGDSHDFLPRALSAGAAVGLGTDGAASNSTMNISEAARLAALTAKSSAGDASAGTLAQVLPLMFSGGDVFGLSSYGRVVPGSVADLVLLDLSTPAMFPGNNIFADILYALDGRNVHTVIVDGRTVVESGRLLSIDYLSLREEAVSAGKRLVSTRADRPMQTY